jgi:hypothetical protein
MCAHDFHYLYLYHIVDIYRSILMAVINQFFKLGIYFIP